MMRFAVLVWLVVLVSAQRLEGENVQEQVRCDHAVVGAGPAGVYYLWRLFMDKAGGVLQQGETACLVEKLDRVGGRIASIKNGDLVVEPGAYRFAPHKFCGQIKNQTVCLWTPVVGHLVQGALKLNSTRYDGTDPSAPDYHLFKITDQSGQNAGFQSFVTAMVREMQSQAKEAGINFRIFLNERLERIITEDERGILLETSSRQILVKRKRGSVLLNLPQIPLLRVLASLTPRGTNDLNLPVQLHLPNPAPYVKLYLHYNHAWWRGGRYGLDLRSGHFSNVNVTSRTVAPGIDTMHVFPGVESPAPLQGAYHDGHVRCEKSDCRGYIQAYYGNDVFAHMYYRGMGLVSNGHAIANITGSSFAGRAMLSEVHAALVNLHRLQLGPERVRAILNQDITQPDHAVLAIWDSAADGFHAACHFSRLGPSAHENVPRRTLRPLVEEKNVFVASEAYGPVQCWAEGALQMAENALNRLGVARPSWLPRDIYADILFSEEPGPQNQHGNFAAKHNIWSPVLALRTTGLTYQSLNQTPFDSF